MVYYLLYFGVEVQKFDSDDLEQLLNQATARNATLDITGKLLYCEGTFIQLLEGHERAVRLVYQSIIKDSRLIAVTKITEGFAEERYFGRWKHELWRSKLQ